MYRRRFIEFSFSLEEKKKRSRYKLLSIQRAWPSTSVAKVHTNILTLQKKVKSLAALI
jgi:hypothetical protein